MRLVTQQDVTSVISDLTNIVEELKTNQFVVRKFKLCSVSWSMLYTLTILWQLANIKTRVFETIRFATNYVAQERILSKAVRGQKLISNVAHTKPKNSKSTGASARNVFPEHNSSPIGKAVIPISASKAQSHPGKATAKTVLHFCKWCGIEVGSK